MAYNPLSPEEKLNTYYKLNAMPSPTENAGVTYIPNPAIPSTTADQSIPFTKMFNDKMPLLSSPTVPAANPTVDNTMKEDAGTYIKPAKSEYTINPYDFSNVRLSTPSGVRVNDNARNAYNYYVNEKGLPAHVAAGIVGNLYRESELKPTAIEQGNTGAGRGIAQWDKDIRWPAYLKWAKENGKSPMDLHSQLDYVLVEPGWGDKALKKTMVAKDSTEAAMIFGKTFERPNEHYARWDLRAGAAKTLFDGL